MIIRFLIIFLIILLIITEPVFSNSILNRSLFQCDVYQEEPYHVICLHLLMEEGGEQLLLYQQDFDQPFQVQKKVMSFLCQIYHTCSLFTFNKVIPYVLDIASHSGMTIFPSSIQAYSTTAFYCLQRHNGENSSYHFTMEKFSLSWLWAAFLHTAIIVSGEACYSLETCELSIHQPNMLQLLFALDLQLEEFLEVSFVDLYYGYYITPDMLEGFIEQCHQLIQYFSRHGKRIRIICEAPFLPSTERNDYQWDFREQLAKYAYLNARHDFFVLLDPSAEMVTPGWLLSSIMPLFFGGVSQGFGITSYYYNLLPPASKPGTITTTITPIITKGVMAAFINHTFSLINVPSILNNLLLINPLVAVGGAAVTDVYFKKQFTVLYDSAYAEDFYDQLLYNKRIVISSLIKDGTYHAKKDYLQLLRHREETDGAMLSVYCQAAAGCKEPFSGVGDQAKDGVKDQVQMIESYNVYEILSPSLNAIIQGASVDAVRASVKNATFYQLDHIFERKYPPITYYDPNAKVAVITAIFGAYEASCKNHAKQTISTNFICFTDNPDIPAKGWIVDTVPYHLRMFREEFEKGYVKDEFINSYHHNLHPFNIAKFYKLSFPRIPVLDQYDVVVWVDGTVSLTNPRAIEKLLGIMKEGNSVELEGNFLDQRLMVVFEHVRNANLSVEVEASLTLDRYNKNRVNKQYQPIQPLMKQYETYLANGFSLNYWENLFNIANDQLKARNSSQSILYRPQYGMWVTCLISFNMRKVIVANDGKRKTIKEFLEFWFDQNRLFSTQDQVSFPYVIQKLGIYPYSLPNGGDRDYEVNGTYDFSNLHVKLDHGM